jgi:hypothetical protein
MSRLYLKGSSDSRKTPITSRGHEEINLGLLYGSAHDSRVAVYALIRYNSVSERFSLQLDLPKGESGQPEHYLIDLGKV